MTKLIYDGVMATGRYKSQNFERIVKKGEKYDIPKDDVEEFLKSGDWKKPETKEKPKKKVSIIKDDSDTEDIESTYGGNKKW